MMIEKLNSANPVVNVGNISKNMDLSVLKTHDSVTLSEDAEKLAEVHLALKIAKAADDVRHEKVVEMRNKLSNPAYVDSVIEGLADRLMEAYGL